MLENIRERLENELKRCSELFKEKCQEYNKLFDLYQREEMIEKAFKDKEDYKEIIIDKVIILILSLMFLGCCSLFEVDLFCLPGSFFPAIFLAFDSIVVKKLIKNVKTYKEINQTIRENNYLNLNEANLNFEKKNYNELKQCFSQKLELLSYKLDELSSLKQYINSLWDTLQGDDIVERINHYNLNYKYFEDVLLAEWEAYLEEISHVSPSHIHLTNFDVHLNDVKMPNKDDQIQLKKENKREKSHNLSIN